jgi:hypothetical protein
MARSTRRSSNVISVDFKGVETRIRVDEGEHQMAVAEVTREKGDKADYLSWKFKVTEGDCEGGVVYTNTSLSKQSLWNLKGLLEALGVEVPDDEMDLDLSEYVDLEMIGVVAMEDYEGKPRPKLVDYAPLKKSKKKDKDEDKGGRRKGKDKDEEEEEEEEEETKGRRGKGKDKDEDNERGSRRRRDKDEEDEGKGRKGKKAKKIAQDEVQDMSQDELEDLIKEHELDVDLDDFKTLNKMRNAVISELEQNDLLEA